MFRKAFLLCQLFPIVFYVSHRKKKAAVTLHICHGILKSENTIGSNSLWNSGSVSSYSYMYKQRHKVWMVLSKTSPEKVDLWVYPWMHTKHFLCANKWDFEDVYRCTKIQNCVLVMTLAPCCLSAGAERRKGQDVLVLLLNFSLKMHTMWLFYSKMSYWFLIISCVTCNCKYVFSV